MQTIISEQEYELLSARCYELMEKGEENLSLEEDKELCTIADKLYDYEAIHYPFTENQKVRAAVLKNSAILT